MDLSSEGSLLLLAILLLIQGILAAMYYALANTRKAILREAGEGGNPVAKRTLHLAENATALLVTQQYISTLLSVFSTAVLVRFVLPNIEQPLQNLGVSADAGVVLALLCTLPIFSFLVLLVGHQLPSAIISGRAEAVALVVSRPMSWLVYGLAPILQLAQPFSQTVGRLLGGSGTVAVVTEEEIKTLVDAGSEGGVIEDDEKEMIYSVFKFSDTLAREVMVPRIDIEALEISTNLTEALDKIVKVGHSRIPVYEGSIDNIRGLVYAKDLLILWRNGEQERKHLRDILREPYFIPESKKAVDLLAELQERKVHLAIVIDEYGGTAGLVTIEDLLEEIVGEIRDEYDTLEEEPYEEISENEYICQAGLDLDDLNDLLGIHLPTDENDTLGGYIFTALGKVPEVGDKVTTENVEMEVLNLDGRRIHKVRVRRLEPQPPAEIPPAEIPISLIAPSTPAEDSAK